MRVLTVDGRDYVCREQYENLADELALTRAELDLERSPATKTDGVVVDFVEARSRLRPSLRHKVLLRQWPEAPVK